jgi:hypothetical protein
VDVARATRPVLLLFLSTGCLGCGDLWEGLSEIREGLGQGADLAVVTKGADEEDTAAVAAMSGRGAGPPFVPIVMSSAAYRDYRVGGPPFFVVVDATSVRSEGVAWGVEATLQTVLGAL